jgi:hypothetical protein
MISELMTIHNYLSDTYTREKQAKLVALPDNQGTTQLAISEGTAE